MKRANRLGASSVLILGENELEAGAAVLRNMATKEQTTVPLDNIVDNLKKTMHS